jgi:ABC-type branched-subunit amino acid transport system substrate-binding protein
MRRMEILAGAVVPLTGRYALQGAQMRIGVELWARRAGTRLLVEDDRSEPARSTGLFQQLLTRGCRLVLPPYGSDSTRALANARPASVVWNHGAAADDVQRLPGVISLPTPASRYLLALGRAVAKLRPGGTVVLATARGPFGRFARDGFEREADGLGLHLAGAFGLADPPERIADAAPDAVLTCGPANREVELFRALGRLLPGTLCAGVSPGLSAFPELLGGDPQGFLAPVQWHPELGSSPELGPSSSDVMSAARESGHPEVDYVGAQAYAAALVAERCFQLDADDPFSPARRLRTTTFFGAFQLDPETGIQRGHRLAVVEWRRGRQELLLAEAS